MKVSGRVFVLGYRFCLFLRFWYIEFWNDIHPNYNYLHPTLCVSKAYLRQRPNNIVDI
jgi:hypothetical protein